MTASHIMFIVICFKADDGNKLVLIATATVLFLFFYQISIGGLIFVILGEVFPLHVKTQFTALGMQAFYLTMLFIRIIYPLVNVYVNYCIYISFVVVLGVVLMIWLPETTGKTLDEI